MYNREKEIRSLRRVLGIGLPLLGIISLGIMVICFLVAIYRAFDPMAPVPGSAIFGALQWLVIGAVLIVLGILAAPKKDES